MSPTNVQLPVEDAARTLGGMNSTRTGRLLVVTAGVSAAALSLLVGTGSAKDGEPGKDGRVEVRVAGVCGAGAKSRLRLRGEDGEIELRFEVEHARAGRWRIVVVQERRIVWRGTAKTTTQHASFEIERVLNDLPGADAVTARAWGPNGLGCRATAILREAG